MKKANKRNGSKAIAILLSLLLCLTMIPQAAFAQGEENYTINFQTRGMAFENTGLQWDEYWNLELDVRKQEVKLNYEDRGIAFGIVNYFEAKNPIQKIIINGDEYLPPTSHNEVEDYYW